MKNKCRKTFILITVIVLAVVVLVFFPGVTKTAAKSRTFSYVQSNQDMLCEIADDVINGKIKTPYQYADYTVQYFKSASVKEPVVEFNSYGFGIAPAGYYTGFYYSPKDIPVRFQGSGTAMEPFKNGWAYHEGGDNHGYTEKICDNWYWFEFYF